MSHSPRSPAFFPISSAASPSPIANIDISDTDEPMIMPHDVALNVDESDLIDVTIDEQTTFPSQIPVSPQQHQHVKHEAAVPEKEPDSTIDNKIDKDASHSIISPPATAPSSTRAQFPLPLPLPPPPKHIAHHTASASPTNGTISHPAPLPIRMQLPLRLGNKTGTIAQTKPIIPHPISILPASKPMDDMDETDLRVDDISHTTSSSSVPRVSSCIPIRVGSRMVNPYILLCIFVAGQASNTIMWLTFPSLPRESKGAFDLTDFELTLFLNWGAILPLLLMVPFSTLISRRDGLKRALRAAAFFLFFGASIRSIPLFFSTEYLHGHKDLVLFLLQTGSILNAFALPIFLASPSLIGQQFFPVHVRAVVSSMAATSNQLGNTIAFLFPYVCSSVSGLYRLCWIQWGMSALIAFALYVYFPPDEITYPHSDTADVTHPSTPSRIRTHHTREMDESQEIPLTLMETEPPSDAGEVEEMNDESHIPATHDISTTSIDPEIVVPSTHLISRDSIISNTSQNSSQPTPRPRRSSLIPMQRTSLVQLMSAPNVNANNDAVVTVPAARADASWLSRTGATLWLWWHALRSMKNPSFFACLVACGLGNGVWSGWMPHIPLVFENVLSEEESGTLSAAAYFSGVLGGLMSGPITEKCFPNKHKAFASILLTLSLFGFMWLTLCAPSPFGKALITSSSLSLYGMLSFPIILVGLAQGALVPLSYELCADLSYGVLHEGVSGGVYQLVDNAFNSCFLFIAPMAFVTNTHATNLIGIIAFLLSLIALVPVNPSYQRLHDREGETDPNGDGAETGDGQVGEGHVMHKDADSAAFYRQGRL